MIPFLDLADVVKPDAEAINIAVAGVVASGDFHLGQCLEDFESAFSQRFGGAHVVGVSSGTAAITLLLRAHGVGTGDDVLVSAFTCSPSWQGIHDSGARPVGVDVALNTRCLDVDALDSALTPQTKAVLAVHLFGCPCDMTQLREFCYARGLLLLSDAAQAFGSGVDGVADGLVGDGAAFSFYPTKNLAALGDAGAVVVPSLEIAECVRELRHLGVDSDGGLRWLSANYRMDEIQAAVLSVRMKSVDPAIARRREIARRYIHELPDVKGLSVPDWSDDHAWHLFVVTHSNRDRLRDQLAECGVGTAVHYAVPPSLDPLWRSTLDEQREFSVTRQLADSVLSLPLNPAITDSEITDVIGAVRTSCANL